jgi:ribosomal-protein-alanine N-acetyltransferase
MPDTKPEMLNPQLLETERLLLKGFSPADMKYIFENLRKNEIMELLGHRSEEAYQKEEHKQKNGYAAYNRSFILFLLTDKASGAVIGRCGIHNWNVDNKRAEVGYHMEDESCKRKGLMTEALGAVIDYGFHKLNLNRIEALVGATNIPSLRLMEIYKFRKEGILRQHYYVSGQYEDSVMFSKLYSEHVQGSNSQ